MMAPEQDDARLLLHAALDGELDAAGMLALERRLSDEPQLAADYANLKSLQGLLQTKLPRYTAPDRLRERVQALAAAPAKPPVRWPAMAASALIAASLASGATWLAVAPQAGGSARLSDTLVADHRRGLLAGQPVDVASTDRHTVKPWFATRVGLAPQVLDLEPQGFALVGGRLDVIDGMPVPTLVYRHREHLISLTALPAAKGIPATGAVNGYAMTGWRDGDIAYWAVSDIDAAELDKFRHLFQAAASANER